MTHAISANRPIYLSLNGEPHTTSLRALARHPDSVLYKQAIAAQAAQAAPHDKSAPLDVPCNLKAFRRVLGHVHGHAFPTRLKPKALLALASEAQTFGFDALAAQARRKSEALHGRAPSPRACASLPMPARSPSGALQKRRQRAYTHVLCYQAAKLAQQNRPERALFLYHTALRRAPFNAVAQRGVDRMYPEFVAKACAVFARFHAADSQLSDSSASSEHEGWVDVCLDTPITAGRDGTAEPPDKAARRSDGAGSESTHTAFESADEEMSEAPCLAGVPRDASFASLDSTGRVSAMATSSASFHTADAAERTDAEEAYAKHDDGALWLSQDVDVEDQIDTQGALQQTDAADTAKTLAMLDEIFPSDDESEACVAAAFCTVS